MKCLAALLLVVSLQSAAIEAPTLAYNAQLAQQLGADDHGMKLYTLVLLRTGPRTDLTQEQAML